MSNIPMVPAKPTKLLIEKNAKDEITKGRLEDGTLLYVNLQDGQLKFGSETERDLTAQVAVTKETSRNWKSVFNKNPPKEVPTTEFEKQFKIPPPYPEQEDQYVIRLKSATTYKHDNPERDQKAGDLIPYEHPGRPKLYEIVDGKPVDITKTTQVANGSKGIVAFRVSTNQFGTFPTLAGIVVTDLIEKQQQASLASDFGITADTPTTKRIGVAPSAHSNNDDVHDDIIDDSDSSDASSGDDDWAPDNW